jgi:uncharacterized membrane protein YfcA
LLVLGVWLIRRTIAPSPRRQPLSPRSVRALALAVGVLGGVYGIGGGSLLSPLLVGSGMSVAVVAPAALASTFVTSIVGACTFAVLALFTPGAVAPDWSIGVACGVGGLLGGYLGARLQPFIPETSLRAGLGCLAVSVGVLYLAQAVI